MNMEQRPAPYSRNLGPRQPIPVFSLLFLFVLCLPWLISIVSPQAKYSLREEKNGFACRKQRLGPGILPQLGRKSQ
jgi:hypothetical protein